MEFDIKCDCGQGLRVSVGQAGSTISCRCGREVRIPNSMKLREMANLAPVEPEPELVLRAMFEAGEFDDTRCSICGGEAISRRRVLVACEQQYAHHRGSDAAQYGLVFGAIGPLFVSALSSLSRRRDSRDVEMRGRDVCVPASLCFCAACAHQCAPRRAGRWLGLFSRLSVVTAIVLLLTVGYIAALWMLGAAVGFRLAAWSRRRDEATRLRELVLRRAEYQDLFQKYPRAVVLDAI